MHTCNISLYLWNLYARCSVTPVDLPPRRLLFHGYWMIDRDIIPLAQYRRLDITTNVRGEVTFAKAPHTVLEWAISKEILSPETEYYYNIISRMRRQALGGVKAANLDGVVKGGDDFDNHYTKILSLLSKNDLESFLAMGEKQMHHKWREVIYSQAGVIRDTVRKIEKFIDDLDEL